MSDRRPYVRPSRLGRNPDEPVFRVRLAPGLLGSNALDLAAAVAVQARYPGSYLQQEINGRWIDLPLEDAQAAVS